MTAGAAPVEVSSAGYVCALGADTPAAVEVEAGSILRVECRSAADRIVGAIAGRAAEPNPGTGPIAVRGAVPGQALRLRIIDISPVSVAHMKGDQTGAFRQLPIADGTVVFADGIRIPLAPMIGMIGVAPARGSWQTTDCGLFGGNMDSNDVAAGATVHLPVFQPGGKLVIGDVHAVMADGEIGGQGAEAAATVTLEAGIEPQPLSDHVYVVGAGHIAVVGTGATVDAAVEDATDAAIALIANQGLMDRFSARKFLGLVGHTRFGQHCCPIKSVRVSIPLRYFPAATQ